MKPAFPFLLCALVAGMVHAQQQEQGLLERIDSNRRKALDAMNQDGKSKKKQKADQSLVSPLASRSFSATSTTGTKTFNADGYGGVKSAEIKTYETRSFLGVKNPWFGRKIFDTNASAIANRSARESREQFKTDSFETRKFEAASKPDLKDTDTPIAASAQPRPYLAPPKAQGGVDQFTHNLKKDLSIDDVRDLLNKGKGN